MSESMKTGGTGSVRDDLIKLASKMLMNRGNYPTHPDNQDFKMSQRAWSELDTQHKHGDEFFRQVGIELSELANRLPARSICGRKEYTSEKGELK